MYRHLLALAASLLFAGTASATGWEEEGDVVVVTTDAIVIQDAKGVYHEFALSDRVKANENFFTNEHLLRDVRVGQTLRIFAARPKGDTVWFARMLRLVRTVSPAPRPVG